MFTKIWPYLSTKDRPLSIFLDRPVSCMTLRYDTDELFSTTEAVPSRHDIFWPLFEFYSKNDFFELTLSWKGKLERWLSSMLERSFQQHDLASIEKNLETSFQHKIFQLNDLSNCRFQLHVFLFS